VSWYSDVFKLVFPNLDRDKANTCKACEWKKEHGSKTESDENNSEKSD
jgi:ATP-dependent Lon protease